MTIHENQHVLADFKVSKYENQYGDIIAVAAEGMREKYEYEWTPHDTLAIGQYADNWQSWLPMMEADMTSRNTLGPAIQSNLGLIAMAYASMPIQNLASVQPLSDEAGTVFFREAVAVNERGEVQSGDVLINAMGAVNNKVGTFTNETQVKSIVIGAPATLEYDVSLGGELRPGGVRISVAGGKVKGQDDGEGHILGVGIDADNSTVNYTTGAVKVVFTDLAGKGVAKDDTIDITYRQSVIDAKTIPTMKWILSTKVVQADYYVLQSQYSNLSELVLRKRFGSELSDQVSADLVSQVTTGVMNDAIRKLRDASIRNEINSGRGVTWAMAAAPGVSDFDHRRTFDDQLIEAVDIMYQLAGKGEVSALVVGSKGKQILTTAGMRTIKNAVSGPHLCGMYGSVPVYYAPQTVLGANEILVVYRGANWHEAPLVYAPFLPLTTVSGKAVNNVLTNAQAAYHAAALETVVEGFVVRILIS